MDLDRLTHVFIKIRDAKAELANAYKIKDAELTAQMDTIKAALLEYCDENSVESVRTNEGTFYRQVRTRFWTSDWESLHKFVLEHNVPELLEKRLHQGNVKQFLDENPDLVPPGMNADTEYVLTIRKNR